jgi:predicted RNase H-like nuclease (RuvC/YqgF family)
MSTKLKVGATVAVLLGFAGLFQLQQLKINHLTAEIADLRSQLGQMEALQDTNESLAQQLKSVVESSRTNQNELLRLRGQGVRFRQLEQENAQLKAERQQLALRMQQPQAAAVSPEEGQVTAVTEVVKKADASPTLDTTDLGPLELQNGTAIHFDLGGGTNCVVTPTALSDGNNTMQIKVGVTNADGTFSELGVSRITARPGQHCSISVGDRMIGLAVTLKPQ